MWKEILNDCFNLFSTQELSCLTLDHYKQRVSSMKTDTIPPQCRFQPFHSDPVFLVWLDVYGLLVTKTHRPNHRYANACVKSSNKLPNIYNYRMAKVQNVTFYCHLIMFQPIHALSTKKQQPFILTYMYCHQMEEAIDQTDTTHTFLFMCKKKYASGQFIT